MRRNEVVNTGFEGGGVHGNPRNGCKDGGEEFEAESQVTGHRNRIGAWAEAFKEQLFTAKEAEKEGKGGRTERVGWKAPCCNTLAWRGYMLEIGVENGGGKFGCSQLFWGQITPPLDSVWQNQLEWGGFRSV